MTNVQIPYMASRQELHEAATLARKSSPSNQDNFTALPKQLELRLQDERGLWTVALEQSEAETAQAMQSLSDYLQRQVLDAADIAVRVEAQVAGLESRMSMALSELDVRQQAERTERGSDLVAVRNDLDHQWEELSKGLAAAMAETEARAQKDKHELLDALAAVCSDIEALRKQQKEYPSLDKIIESCRDLQEPLQQGSSSMRSDFARISAEVHDLQLQQAKLRGNIEQALRDDLQSFVVEELQVRRLNELEALQTEDSRHRADIDALRDKQNVALEAIRQEEAVKREASEAKCLGELQAMKQQLANCMEAFSTVPPPLPAPAEDNDVAEVFERLLQELREECGVLGERLGEDVAQLRAQLAQGIGEVRTAQVQQEGDLQTLRSTWETRWEELQASKEAAEEKTEVEDMPDAPIALPGGPSVEDFQAMQQKHESHATDMKHRLSMQNREIEELQRQLLDTLRDLGAVKRLSSEVEGLRQERQRDLAELMDIAKQRDAGEWNIFKAFGCRADKTSDRAQEDPLERQVCQRPPNMATSEELELLRGKQRQEAQELRSQQRSFFDEVLDQQAASQQLFSSELEAVRSHCDAAIAGFHSHQTNTVEVLRQQQRRMQQIQGQLLGDVGSLKSQLIGTIRQQSTRTEEICNVVI